MGNSAEPISEEHFNDVIPTSLRPYIHVASLPLPADFRAVLDAFRIAVESLEKRIRVARPLEVVVAKAPFKMRLTNGTLCYTPNHAQIINVHIEDRIIFLDVEKIARYEQGLQVAVILEEFAHALMNISDEQLVSEVVALLYSGVKIVNGQYHAVGQST